MLRSMNEDKLIRLHLPSLCSDPQVARYEDKGGGGGVLPLQKILWIDPKIWWMPDMIGKCWYRLTCLWAGIVPSCWYQESTGTCATLPQINDNHAMSYTTLYWTAPACHADPSLSPDSSRIWGLHNDSLLPSSAKDLQTCTSGTQCLSKRAGASSGDKIRLLDVAGRLKRCTDIKAQKKNIREGIFPGCCHSCSQLPKKIWIAITAEAIDGVCYEGTYIHTYIGFVPCCSWHKHETLWDIIQSSLVIQHAWDQHRMLTKKSKPCKYLTW